MNDRLMLKIGRLGMASLILTCSSGGAGANGMDATLSAEVSSRYMWNAFDRLDTRGLETGAVFQPRLTLSLMGSPLRVHVGGSFLLEQDAEVHEVLYGVSVKRSVSPLTQFGLGYNYYDDQADAAAEALANPGSAIAEDGHEIWTTLVVASPTGVQTNMGLRWEDPKAAGSDAYYVGNAGLAFNLPVVPAAGLGGVSFDLNWNTSVFYNTGVKVDGVDVVGRGISAWQVGMAGTLQAAGVAVSPYVNYQVTIEPSVLDENPFWAGVGVSYTF